MNPVVQPTSWTLTLAEASAAEAGDARAVTTSAVRRARLPFVAVTRPWYSPTLPWLVSRTTAKAGPGLRPRPGPVLYLDALRPRSLRRHGRPLLGRLPMGPIAGSVAACATPFGQ